MKIALCLYGHFRNFNNCYPGIKEHLLDLFPVDVFAMTWGDNKGHHLPLNHNANNSHPGYDTTSPKLSNQDLTYIINNLQPKSIHIDNFNLQQPRFNQLHQKYFPWKLPNPYHRTIGMFSMNWARKCSLQIKKDYEIANNFIYDIVIALRWDITLTNPMNFNVLPMNRIIMPRTCNNQINYVGHDELVLGPSYYMDIWGTQFDSIEEFARLGYKEQEPHLFAEFHLDYYKVPMEYIEGIPFLKQR